MWSLETLCIVSAASVPTALVSLSIALHAHNEPAPAPAHDECRRDGSTMTKNVGFAGGGPTQHECSPLRSGCLVSISRRAQPRPCFSELYPAAAGSSTLRGALTGLSICVAVSASPSPTEPAVSAGRRPGSWARVCSSSLKIRPSGCEVKAGSQILAGSD